MSQLRTLKSLSHMLPFASQTLYNGHRRGRYPWLTRNGPDGRRTRDLWVDLEKLRAWADARGYEFTRGHAFRRASN